MVAKLWGCHQRWPKQVFVSTAQTGFWSWHLIWIVGEEGNPTYKNPFEFHETISQRNVGTRWCLVTKFHLCVHLLINSQESFRARVLLGCGTVLWKNHHSFLSQTFRRHKKRWKNYSSPLSPRSFSIYRFLLGILTARIAALPSTKHVENCIKKRGKMAFMFPYLRFSDFKRFLYGKVLWNTDFFEQT